MTEQLLTRAQLSKKLNVSLSTLKLMLPTLPAAINIHGWRWRESDIDAWISAEFERQSIIKKHAEITRELEARTKAAREAQHDEWLDDDNIIDVSGLHGGTWKALSHPRKTVDGIRAETIHTDNPDNDGGDL
jgi:predicted DNA-binding transcriptional regulator AlpA